jgi:subfamily B ATP-binding cassette protein MsbA
MGSSPTGQQIAGGILFLTLPVLFRSSVTYLSGYCLAWVSERAINDLRADVFNKLNSLSLDYFNRSPMGDLTTRINGDTAALYNGLRMGFLDAIKEPITMICLFIGLCIVDWQLTLIAAVFLVVCFYPIQRLGKKTRRAAKGSVQTGILQSSQLFESLSGIRVVKAFRLEAEQLARFHELSRQLIHHGMKGAQAYQLVNPLIEVIAMLGFGILIVWIISSHRQLPDVGGFVAGVMLMQAPVKRLATLHMTLQSASVGVDRLRQTLAEQPTVKESSTPKHLAAFQTDIRFDRVSFSYGDRTVLDDIALVIPRGTKLGIAGESGSGKSTLANLLFRFYDPTHGSIRLDGVDLRDLAVADHRQLMALVSQEIVLFDKTVAENIVLGRPGATRAEIEDAARHAFAYEFIQQLPHGFDSRIGERGVTLSGGQRQRLAIARAFVRNSPILVLDEATASLDSQAEAEVQTAIDRLAENRTVVSIAHRLSTLANCDRIIVLRQGRIVEQGGYEELLRTGGVFATMAAQQGIRATSHAAAAT